MNPFIKQTLLHSRMGLAPVRIRHGFLRGARWTLWPHSAYWRGHYEPEVQTALSRHIPPLGSAAWDLGAHFGFYSLWLARAVGVTGEVASFEPDSTSFARLRRHLALNPWANVRAYECATSDHDGRANLIQSEGAGETTSHFAYAGEVASDAGKIAVTTISLDALIARENFQPPVLIKIDIEGHAPAALRGAEKTLTQFHPRLLTSLHSPEECSGLRDVLEPIGYRVSDLNDQPIEWADAIFQTVWYHV